ncbi:MAG: YraN family protein [Kiritimatiellae bacterium]|nr:YraN family protein [Kiritimatiellia bacterium]
MERVLHYLRTLWQTIRRGNAAAKVSPTTATGQWGETLAAELLRKKGFRILGRNVRPNRHNDELDIVAKNKDYLVFVEVKTRSYEWQGVAPAAAVNQKKRHALNRAAAAYLKQLRYPKLIYRFDIIEVVGSRHAKEPPQLNHIEFAFPFEQSIGL